MSGYTKEAVLTVLKKKLEGRQAKVDARVSERAGVLAEINTKRQAFVTKVSSQAAMVLDATKAWEAGASDETWRGVTAPYNVIRSLWPDHDGIGKYDRETETLQRAVDELKTFIDMLESATYETFSQSQLKDLGLLNELRRGVNW